jgi:hypothetical protein
MMMTVIITTNDDDGDDDDDWVLFCFVGDENQAEGGTATEQ